MNNMSRVMPALLTRMSRPPIAASAAGTSFSVSSFCERLQGNMCVRPFNSPASASSASFLVPESATIAPAA